MAGLCCVSVADPVVYTVEPLERSVRGETADCCSSQLLCLIALHRMAAGAQVCRHAPIGVGGKYSFHQLTIATIPRPIASGTRSVPPIRPRNRLVR